MSSNTCFQICLLLLLSTVQACAFQQTDALRAEMKEPSQVSFVEAVKDFPRVEKNLRKWDAPVVADLDQDGHPDLLINDHGYGVRVCWNNEGKFAAPFDIITGDMHGVTVGDFDHDGNLELVISRGGGSGSNARNSKLYRVGKDRSFEELPDFETPLELMRGRTVKFFDGDGDGDLDLLEFAFPDKDKKGQSENYIYENNGAGQLNLKSNLPPIKMNGQKTLITDYNGDAIPDLILYGHGTVKVYKGGGDLTYTDVTSSVMIDNAEHVTAIVEIDYDNDGDFDLFMTRGSEFKIGETFYDKETKLWGFFTKRGAFRFDDLETGDILNIENFQSQWPDNDAFHIGESGYAYEFEGETHSGKNIRLVNSDALGFPDKKHQKRGTHIGYIGNNKWRLAGTLNAPATGTVHGVKSYPAYDHPPGYADILLENDKGKFIDVTVENKLTNVEHTMAAAVADLDNNGLQDIVVIRRGDLIHDNESIVYLNHDNAGFKASPDHGIVTTELGAIGMAIETIDYNQDGRQDIIIGNERGKWHLFKNTLADDQDNQFITIDLSSIETDQHNSLGALVSLKSCGRTQRRRVGATGANYSLSYNQLIHFGLADCREDVEVTVRWSDGQVTKKVMSLNK